MQPETLSRRVLLGAALGTAATTACAQVPRPAPELVVYKTPTCGCCTAWVDRMRAAGFSARIIEQPDLAPIRKAQGVMDTLAACHTALINGYALEGHVPAEDVRRLLVDRPVAIGLAVPAMPLGSPGMEMPDGRRQPFETLLMLRGGATRVFARHG
ncbi:DUF411 domain-containing protein [Brevundimonas aurifodinae]|uniref:DUF411 domain-containing protein n=1 Tax=Brevundimonas aurifodinae TaxID=1508312 RepID=A0ABV1NKH6_9CAUL